MAHVATHTHGGLTLNDRIVAFISKVKANHALRVEYNRTYSELQNLSDRELNDIGVRRCDIGDIVRNHVYCA